MVAVGWHICVESESKQKKRKAQSRLAQMDVNQRQSNFRLVYFMRQNAHRTSQSGKNNGNNPY